jgi:hypothetical protein
VFRIRIRMDLHWFGSLDPDPDLDPHWGKSWIRNRIETNADPKHRFVTGSYLAGLVYDYDSVNDC